MDNLKSLMDGEYTPAMYGVNTEKTAELLGAIAKLPKEKQGQAIRNLFKRSYPVGVGNSRYEMELKADLLPKEIYDGLIKKRLQLVDTRFYVVKDIAGKSTIDIFQGTDNKGVGLGNIANQKLEKDNWFLLYGISMRYAVSATKEAADFSHIVPVIRNGEFELEAGNKKLIGMTENSAFDTRERQEIPIGFYKLESTKVIEPQIEIKMPVKFAAAAEASTFLRVTFIGTSVIPY